MTTWPRLSPRAQDDVDEIFEFTRRRWGLEQADHYVRQIARHIERLTEHPGRGGACPEIRAGYYKFPSGSHVLFYRITDNGIEVIRILHGRMDYPRHL